MLSTHIMLHLHMCKFIHFTYTKECNSPILSFPPCSAIAPERHMLYPVEENFSGEMGFKSLYTSIHPHPPTPGLDFLKPVAAISLAQVCRGKVGGEAAVVPLLLYPALLPQPSHFLSSTFPAKIHPSSSRFHPPPSHPLLAYLLQHQLAQEGFGLPADAQTACCWSMFYSCFAAASTG